MEGIDAAREQAVVRVEGDVLYEIAQIPAAAGRMGIGGAAERLVLDRCTFLRERHCEFAAYMLPQAFIRNLRKAILNDLSGFLIPTLRERGVVGIVAVAFARLDQPAM